MSSASNIVIKNLVTLNRPSRRLLSSTSSARASTSPQRRKPAAALKEPSREPKRFTDIPGPLALPMLRHSAYVLPRIGNFHHVVGLGLLDGLCKKYGDIVRLAKGSRSRPVLYIFDPELMREIYESRATTQPIWTKSPLGKQRESLGCPLHSEENLPIWSALRTLLQDGTVQAHYRAALDQIARDATNRIGKLRKVNNALNEELETELYRWAIEALGVVIFGKRLGCLDETSQAENKHIRTNHPLEEDLDKSCSLSRKPPEHLSAAERLVVSSKEIADGTYLTRSDSTLRTDSEVFNQALKAFDSHYSLIQSILVSSLEELDSERRKPEQVFLEKLKPLKSRLLPIVTDMMLAGVEPLVQTSLSMLYQLSLHAAQQQRVHDEVLWAQATVEAGGTITELPYTNASVREVLRLFPATGGVVRRTKEEVVVGGYSVPVGVDIVLAHGVSSKNEAHWGRASSFLPDRWHSDGWQPLKACSNSYASLPFGESCPGKGIVGVIMASLASNLCSKYRLEWHGPSARIHTASVNKLQPPFYFVLQNAA